ncbi:MAG: CpaF family protein [Candidatus Omnitrophica bacterium]|nr:CpaF family protein [Candidatus Omnitrophota bacterium]
MVNKNIKDRVRRQFIAKHINIFSQDSVDEAELRNAIMLAVDEALNFERMVISAEEKRKVIEELMDEFHGFGPIETLLKDPGITEIMINGPDKIFAEKDGVTKLTGVTFDNEQQLSALIFKLLAPTRRRVDESYPFTDLSLKDGSRVNIIIPPLALDGPTITIRKFSKDIVGADDLIRLGTLDHRMADFLIACIKAKVNMLFAGATGTGKTTTVAVLSGYISNDERIVTIEDTAELHLNQPHVVRLESRPANIEGKGEVTIRHLFKNSLRMRPDRIILGEIRGSEALDMLQAICSGHTGSLAVLHANTPQEVIYRLETMILTSGVPINLEVIHRQIAAAIHLIIQQDQLVDGGRRITRITQVNGLKDGQVNLEDIFVYDIDGVDAGGKVKGRWKATGVKPVFMQLFKKAGINLSDDLFKKD